MEDKRNTVSSYLFTIIIAILLALFIRHFIFTSNKVVGESMYPTLDTNDRLIALVYPLKFKNPDYSDIVILKSPIEEGKDYIKRVIGKPGDEVEIKNGHIYLNDNLLIENYTEKGIETGIYNDSYWKLKENEFFVVGDNRQPQKSSDSRAFGPIKKEDLKGIVKLRYFPFSRFRTFGG
ncbi:MAG: signal peptidase I [Peptoniphilaceae bacterium]